MPCPRIPEKAIKSLLARNKRDLKKNKKNTRPSKEDRGSHHEQTYYVHGYLIA
jgi:hypothetical protein